MNSMVFSEPYLLPLHHEQVIQQVDVILDVQNISCTGVTTVIKIHVTLQMEVF
jgi:hypothetical protein